MLFTLMVNPGATVHVCADGAKATAGQTAGELV